MLGASLAVATAACQFDRGGSRAQPGPGEPDAEPAISDGGGDSDGAAAAGYQKSITLPGPGELLADFPLYLELVDPDLAAHAAADGSDIYFVDAAGQSLDRELQRWDPGTGRLEAWVRVSLAADQDTVITLRYGEPTEAPAPDGPGVWASGFAAVWHLEEAPVGASSIFDSLGAVPGTPGGGMNAANSIAGELGRGLDLDGNNDIITFANPLAGPVSHTFSAWVDQDATGNNDALLAVGNGATDEARWLHTRFDSATIAVGLFNDDWADTGANIQGAGWTLVHWTYQAGTSRVYRNGAEVPDDGDTDPFPHTGVANTTGTNGFIGNVPNSEGFGSNLGLNGTIDEVRIATTVRSATWIAVEYKNQSDPAAFYAVGAEQAR